MFTVGMKVVCIDNRTWEKHGKIMVDSIYLIDGIGPHKYDGETVLYLHEFPQEDMGFYARRFRPLVEPKQEISFTTGADPKSEPWDNRLPVEVSIRRQLASQRLR